MSAEPGTRALIRWLNVVCASLVLLVVVGGITRLTGSGLSIVEWKPVTGVLPPLSHAAWERAFSAYQQSPQYRLVNAGMSLSEFQAIYFWEYVHRLLGRVVALAFAVPLIVLGLRRKLHGALARRLWIAVALFGAQGALGWIMVRSGLVDQPAVSHFRLAAHLSLALTILAYLAWTARSLAHPDGDAEAMRPRIHAGVLWAVLSLQIVYGAFTAGLRAGAACSTFPSWNGSAIPPEFFALSPAWWNALANPSAVQFIHRVIGTAWLLVVGALLACGRRHVLTSRQRRAARALLIAAPLQYALGIATVRLLVPVPIAALHQLGACVVFLLALELNHASRPRSLAVARVDLDQFQPAGPPGDTERITAIGTL